MIYGHSMVRPAIHRFGPEDVLPLVVPLELSEELELTKWGWVSFFDLYRNVWLVWEALQEVKTLHTEVLLLEFADFPCAHSRYVGVSFMQETMKRGSHDFKWRPICKPDISGAERFFWRRADLERYGAWLFAFGGKKLNGGDLFVPSGWSNAVLDEIERRRNSHEPFFQATHQTQVESRR